MKKHYQLKKAEHPPVLNSAWDGPEWENANILEVDIVREESSSHHPKTELKLLYNNKAVFGLFRVKDKYVRAVRSGFQESVCKDSCVEFFFKPKSESGYFNFEFNCGGAMLCFYIIDNKRTNNGFAEFVKLKDTELNNVNIFHTLPSLVDPEITDYTEWFLGFEIPLSMLEKHTGSLGNLTDQTWEANCYKCADETSHPHWMSWNPIDEKNFHCPQCFGQMEFK